MNRSIDLDGTLKEWPAPEKAESSWEERADAIMKAAVAHKEEAEWEGETLEALMAAPSLTVEPGEPNPSGAGGGRQSAGTSSEPALLRVSGDRKMSDEKDQERSVPPPSSISSGPSSISSGPRSKRPSLREMAERHSTRTPLSTPLPGRSSSPSISTPVPGAPAVSTPVPPPLSGRGSLSTPLPRAPGSTSTPLPSRPVEAGKDDSGVVDLGLIRSTATKEQEEAAAKARPASEGLFEDDDKAAARAPSSARKAGAVAAAPASRAAAAPVSAKKKGSGGVVAGAVIAVLGIAAAVAMTQRDRFMPPAEAPAPVAAEAKPDQPAEPASPEQAPPPADTAQAQAPADPAETAAPVAVAPRPGGPLPPAAAPAPAPEKPGAAATADPAKPAPPPSPDATGTLAEQMKKAVGADGKPIEGDKEKPEPASGGKSSGSIPEQPPQGSVSAAVGSVMGGAKACVSGASDVSRATITFGSNGSVKSVAVTGWAASNGATGCVKSALQGANVGPFSKPSFTVGVTIRP